MYVDGQGGAARRREQDDGAEIGVDTARRTAPPRATGHHGTARVGQCCCIASRFTYDCCLYISISIFNLIFNFCILIFLIFYFLACAPSSLKPVTEVYFPVF